MINTSEINLSIVIPVYNDIEVLDELNSRLMQTIPSICTDFEILLIDDGSSDDSWNKIKELREKKLQLSISYQ